MKTKHKSSAAKLEYFKALYENAKSAYAESYELLDRNMRQYKGSTEIDGSTERASATRNITYEIVESQISSDIPAPKIDPEAYSEERDRRAQSIERLCRNLRDKLPFEEMNDLDERYTYIYGGSVWYIEWDNSLNAGREVGGVRIHCISPKDFLPQPNVYSVEDMEYCFLKFITTRAELTRRYGVKEADTYLADTDTECSTGLADDDTVSVILAFYKGEDGGVGRFIYSGDLILSDMDRYYSRKVRVCKGCGRREDLCGCKAPVFKTENQNFEHIPDPYGESEGKDVPYYLPKSFPIVIRKNTSVEKNLFGQSDCEYIRPEQQAINKIETRILQKLLRSGVTPIVPEDASIAVNNSVFGQVIKMKPGESMAQYGKVDTTPDISQDLAEAERLYDHAKRTLGISDAFQGISEHANESGYARQLRISQASGRLESKKKMKYAAYAAIDRIIFLHYLAFADEPRCLSYKDSFGRVHDEYFNRYDFLEYNVRTKEYYYDDGYLFSVDLNGGAEYQREALWERNLENLKSGSLGDPTSKETLLRYWQCQERAHYPYARENVEYFRELTKKGGRMSDERIGQGEEFIQRKASRQ